MVTSQMNLKSNVKAFLEQAVGLYINGEYVPAKNGRTFPVYNPATEEVLVEVSEAQGEDVDLAVNAAKKAFESGEWPRLSAAERSHLIYKFADLLEAHKEELAQLETLDNGKPYHVALEDDIAGTVEHFRYYAGWATKVLGQTVPISPDYLNYTVHEPVGVVGQIIPWNFPLSMASWKLGSALATGCTTVLKPAEQTPLSILYAAQLLEEAGFPKGVVNIVPGYGEIAGEAIVTHSGIDKLAFTGSTSVGKSIMCKAAEHVRDVTLELGGKSPNLILEDADVEKAMVGAFEGIMYNQGQNCSATSRVYVHRKHYDRVVEALVERANATKLGNGLEADTDMGPLVSKEQFERVLHYIEIGKEEGAKLVAGGESVGNKGYFVKPTVFADVEDDMRIAREEIFGPVVAVFQFDTTEEAIRRANDSHYGLAAAVWTENIRTGHQVARRLKAGTVWINDCNQENPAAAFGGYKQSGIGREMGNYALDNYTEVKSIWVNLQ
ncbi:MULTISPECIES: aldehyde dehydrogenase family protein [Clostridia]|uniref:aldehyde dehydrogenase family protein n=1 Tax=Clostridia TaxID=186801 RepID=UPI000EA25C5C|nr:MULTISPECIES: aldehyde dehydrogenase family protein [Clostridia]NBJ69227.1 aldehyde dehydrogenase family protein [Roseburia sp. 1XD42-34]RKI79196.1 aldehyde dehydrogenase family protein [Clostridium sp. 1xD42-85]